MIARGTTRHRTNLTSTANFHYQRSGGTKGPLPAELITKRPKTSMPPTTDSAQQPSSTAARYEAKSMETSSPRAATPYRLPAKSLDTDLRQTNEFNFESVTIDEYPDKYRVKQYFIRIKISIVCFSRDQNMNLIHN